MSLRVIVHTVQPNVIVYNTRGPTPCRYRDPEILFTPAHAGKIGYATWLWHGVNVSFVQRYQCTFGAQMQVMRSSKEMLEGLPTLVTRYTQSRTS
jgi:hypothetical protein